jgi:hypothetical protein
VAQSSSRLITGRGRRECTCDAERRGKVRGSAAVTLTF